MPYNPASKSTAVEVVGPPPPPGKVTVTVVVKLFGLIPAPGVDVEADGVKAVTDGTGTAVLTLDEGGSYTVKLSAWWIHPKELRIESAVTETREVAVLPSLLLWSLGSAGAGGLAYYVSDNAYAGLGVGGGVFAVWPISYYILEKS